MRLESNKDPTQTCIGFKIARYLKSSVLLEFSSDEYHLIQSLTIWRNQCEQRL